PVPLARSGRLPPSLNSTRLHRGGSRSSSYFTATVIPQALEAIELTYAGQHDVQDDVLEIDEHPLAVALTLFAEGAESRFLGFINDAVGDGFDVSVRIARRD